MKKLLLNHYNLDDLVVFKKKDILPSKVYPNNFSEGDLLFPYEAFNEELDFLKYLKEDLDIADTNYENVPQLVFIQKIKGKLSFVGEFQLGQEANIHFFDPEGYDTRDVGDVRFSKFALVEITEKGKNVFNKCSHFKGIVL